MRAINLKKKICSYRIFKFPYISRAPHTTFQCIKILNPFIALYNNMYINMRTNEVVRLLEL